VSFIARNSEFTPPVIYSLEERSKLVFLIEARPEQPERLRVGQPLSVTLANTGTTTQAVKDEPKAEPKEEPKGGSQ
jgi:HlyD family secretion protein